MPKWHFGGENGDFSIHMYGKSHFGVKNGPFFDPVFEALLRGFWKNWSSGGPKGRFYYLIKPICRGGHFGHFLDPKKGGQKRGQKMTIFKN